MPLEYCHCIVILLLFIVSLSKIYNCHIYSFSVGYFIVLSSDCFTMMSYWYCVSIVYACHLKLALFIFYTCTFYASIQLPLVGSIKFILSYLITGCEKQLVCFPLEIICIALENQHVTQVCRLLIICQVTFICKYDFEIILHS